MDLWESVKNYMENGTDLKDLLVSLEGQNEETIQLLYGMLVFMDDAFILDDHQEYLMSYLERQYNLKY
ncbi:hypothetical protein ELBI_108 [Anabaena phage Elbi]|nr:hypothetical protein ELBI_108 [Anabaena phage Elbi]